MRLIDADALYREVKTECNPYGKPTIGFDDGKKVMEMINNQPTIDAEPVKHGHWENIPGMNNTVFCSECLAAANKKLAMKYKGCPFCLARMNGGADDDTGRSN